MPDNSGTASASTLSWWRVGTRVSRKSSDDDGTIVEATGQIKVRWDSGKTSYYRPGTLSNITLSDDTE